MAAAKATLLELQATDAARHDDGHRQRVERRHGPRRAATTATSWWRRAFPPCPTTGWRDVSLRDHFDWVDECVKRGVYLLGYHNHFVSVAHDEDDLKDTFDRVNEAFVALGPPEG